MRIFDSTQDEVLKICIFNAIQSDLLTQYQCDTERLFIKYILEKFERHENEELFICKLSKSTKTLQTFRELPNLNFLLPTSTEKCQNCQI